MIVDVMTPKMPTSPHAFPFPKEIYASAALDAPWRPTMNSAIIPGIPKRNTQMMYMTMKAAPPFCPAMNGNLQMLPSPTALPAVARITPIFPKFALVSIGSNSFI